MAKCDICGTNVPVHDMVDLLSCYQTADIRSICKSCESWTNKELWKVRDEGCEMLKARLAERAGRKKRVGWFRRLFSERGTTG